MADDDETPEDEGDELREVSDEELKQILAAHETWLETRGEKGKADLSRTDLQGANLLRANLQEANLGSANLQGADLTGAQYLTREQLDEACGDDKTKLPFGDDGTKLPDNLADYQMKACPTSEQPPSN